MPPTRSSAKKPAKEAAPKSSQASRRRGGLEREEENSSNSSSMDRLNSRVIEEVQEDDNDDFVPTTSKKQEPKAGTAKKTPKPRGRPKKVRHEKEQASSSASSSAASSATVATSSRTTTALSSNTRHTPNTTRRLEVMRETFTSSQHVHNHPKALKMLLKMVKEAQHVEAYDELIRNMKFTLQSPEKSPFTKHAIDFVAKFLIQVNKESNKENVEQPPDEEDLSGYDELGLKTLGNDSFGSGCSSRGSSYTLQTQTLVDNLLTDVFIPYLCSVNTTCRYNTCVLIRKVFMEVDDIDNNIYSRLKKTLVDRMADKNATVRCVAAQSLHRFQELDNPADMVLAAFRFHLRNDPDHDVRQAVLLALEPSKETLDDIIAKTRDVKDLIRKTAFLKLSERIHIKALSIEQRLTLLKDGINDRSPGVRRVVETKLLITWLSAFNNDVVELLVALDIQSDVETIQKMLSILFKSFLDNFVDDSNTKLHEFVRVFSANLLDQRKLLLKQPLSVENSFLWRCLAEFCRNNETRIAPVSTPPENDVSQDDIEKEVDEMMAGVNIAAESVPKEATSEPQEEMDEDVEGNENQEEQQEAMEEDTIVEEGDTPTPPPSKAAKAPPEVDLFDVLVPELPHFCRYIERFCIKVDKEEFGDEELLDFEFIYSQLTKFLILYEVGDDAQKKMLKNLIHTILFLPELHFKFTDYITPLMKVLAKNVFNNSSELLSFTQEVTSEVYNEVLDAHHLIEEPKASQEEPTAVPKRVPLDPGAMRELEVNYAKLTVDIEEKRDELDEALNNKDYLKANELKMQIDSLSKEKEELMNQRQAATSSLMSGAESQAPSQSQSSKPAPNLSEHPEALLKCLQIFAGCLEFGDIKEVDTFMQSHIDKICFPGILSDDPRMRKLAIKALGLCCFINAALAQQYFNLFVQVLNHDVEVVRVMALRAIFDFLCEHGISELVGKQTKTLASAAKKVTKEKARKASSSQEMPVDEDDEQDQEREVEDEVEEEEEEEEAENVSGNSVDDNMTYDQFLEVLTELFVNQLESSSEDIQYTAVQGVGKLLVLGKVFSPNLLSRLIIIWFTPSTSIEIKHFLGVFLPIYAFSGTKHASLKTNNGLSGQSALEECFLDTLETVYKATFRSNDDSLTSADDMTLSSVDLDNVINFMTQLCSDRVNANLAGAVANKIIDLLQEQSSSPSFPANEGFVTKFLVKALTGFTFVEASYTQLKELKMLLQRIDKLMEQKLKTIPQLVQKRMEKVSTKIDALLDHLRAGGSLNSSQLSQAMGEAGEHINDVLNKSGRKKNLSGESGGSSVRAEEAAGEEAGDALEEGAEDSREKDIDYSLLNNESFVADTPPATKRKSTEDEDEEEDEDVGVAKEAAEEAPKAPTPDPDETIIESDSD